MTKRQLVKRFPGISIVVPVFNASSVLTFVVEELIEYLKLQNFDYEIILVNDCSSDSSLTEMKNLQSKHTEIYVINLLKRQGQHKAVLAGLQKSKGAHVVVMDDDGQNPPSEIGVLYQEAKQGHDLVFGKYINYRQTPFRKIASIVMKQVIRFVFKSPKNLLVSNFKIMDRRVVELICKFAHTNPYINGEALLYAVQPISKNVEHRGSLLGVSRYRLSGLYLIVRNVLFSYSTRPIRLLILTTTGFSLMGLLASVYVLVDQIASESDVSGWTSLFLMAATSATLISFSIVVLSEYLIRIFADRPGNSINNFIE